MPAGWFPRTWSGSPRVSSSGEFYSSRPCSQLCAGLRQTGGTLHLVGLLGPGGVHALDHHLLACVELGVRHEVPRHRHSRVSRWPRLAPTLGAEVVRTLLMDIAGSRAARVDIATLIGRYFGMDRDRRWDRTRLAYDAMVHGVGTPVDHPVLAVQAAYQRGEPTSSSSPVHPAERRAGRHDAGRRRRLLLQLSQRPDAADRGRAGDAGFEAFAVRRPSRGFPA